MSFARLGEPTTPVALLPPKPFEFRKPISAFPSKGRSCVTMLTRCWNTSSATAEIVFMPG